MGEGRIETTTQNGEASMVVTERMGPRVGDVTRQVAYAARLTLPSVGSSQLVLRNPPRREVRVL